METNEDSKVAEAQGIGRRRFLANAGKFAAGIAGKSRIEVIAGAGHLAQLDQPDAVAKVVLDWLS